MASALRRTGISVVGDVPWGTHFCQFYEAKEDLLNTLVPCFNDSMAYELNQPLAALVTHGNACLRGLGHHEGAIRSAGDAADGGIDG